MFAVIKTGGKQYQVSEGSTIKVEKLPEDEKKKVTFHDVLLVSEEDGSSLKLGMPTVSGASVVGSVVTQGRAKKVDVVKYKRKIRYHKRTGHRQAYTEVKIEKIAA